MRNKMKNNILSSVIISLLIVFVAFNVPTKWFDIRSWFSQDNLGALSLTDISTTDYISNFVGIQNGNNTLIEDKIALLDATTTITTLTSAPNLVEVGTITTGTWNADAIGVAYGGTGTTSPTLNQVMLGNGSSGFKVVSGFGTSGQFLTSNGVGSAPTWQSSTISLTDSYDWTGLHNWFGGASSTAFSVFDQLAIGRTATTTIQGSSNGTSSFAGDITGTNIVASQMASTTDLYVSGTCVGCIAGGDGASYQQVVSSKSCSHQTPCTDSVACTEYGTGYALTGGGVRTDTQVAQIYINYPSATTTWQGGSYSATAGGGYNMYTYGICIKQ